jgi:hypothetical protein
MIANVFRSMGAVLAAIAAASVLVVTVELLSGLAHPFPADFKGTFEEVCRHVERFPQWVLAAVVGAWGITAFVATWIAGRLGNRGCAVFVGLLLLAALILNILQLPYPLWFKIASPIAIAAAIVCGYGLSRRRSMSTVNITQNEMRYAQLEH